MTNYTKHVQNNLYLPDMGDENVHLGFISNNSSMVLENHILLVFKESKGEVCCGSEWILEVFNAYTKD